LPGGCARTVYAQVPRQLKDQLAEVLAIEGRGVDAGAFPL
jgi:hypothetical protein